MTPPGPPFGRILVANRGEIAVRIIRASHELGMEAVAVYSDADADAQHVRMADIAIRLGPSPPSESYLRIDLIVAAARGYVDDVIRPSETRPRLIRALAVLADKRDTNPRKKHGNIPL